MSQDRTAGYDMLVQVSEAEINSQIETAFLAGTGIFPSSMRVPVDQNGLVGTADLNFLTPIADFDRPRPRLGLTVPFANSQLDITAPLPATLAPLGGTIDIVDTIVVITEGTNQIVALDFTNGAPVVTVAFDAASGAVLAPALAVAGMTQAQAEAMMADMVVTQLQAMQRLDLTPPIPVVDDTDPVTVFSIDVTTVNDVTAADLDCITFGVKMANDSGGNINNVTSNFIPAGGRSLVMMSNFWLLARAMRPRVAAALGTPVTSFDTPLRLNTSIPAPGGTGTLTALEARVVGNRIRVDGTATASGTGWSAVSNFNLFIDIGIAGGSITVTATAPTVNTDVDLAWWVWLLGLGLGGLFDGIIGIIVAAIVLAIVEAIAGSIANGAISTGITGSLGALAPIPLGPLGTGITLDNVILDDLEMRCSIIRSAVIPVKSQGSRLSLDAFAIDLDSGAITSTPTSRSDLVWNPGSGLTAPGAARFGITGGSYAALEPARVSRMPLTSSAIPLSQIPTWPVDWGFFGGSRVVFGLRTGDGRFGKASASRVAVAGGALLLEWVVWDTATPRLDLAGRWSIIGRGEVSEYITDDCRFCRVSTVRWRGVFEAWPALMAFPVDYEWCLCGQVIAPGKGFVDSPKGSLAYELNGRRLVVESDLGDDIDCELCVSAIDARGFELFTCTRLSQSGIDRNCRVCEPKLIDVEIMPPLEEVAGWRIIELPGAVLKG